MDAVFELLFSAELGRRFIEAMDSNPASLASFTGAIDQIVDEDGTVARKNMTNSLRGSYDGHSLIHLRADLSVYEAATTLIHEYGHHLYSWSELSARKETEKFAIANGWPEVYPGFRKADGSLNLRVMNESISRTKQYQPNVVVRRYYIDEKMIFDASTALRHW